MGSFCCLKGTELSRMFAVGRCCRHSDAPRQIREDDQLSRSVASLSGTRRELGAFSNVPHIKNMCASVPSPKDFPKGFLPTTFVCSAASSAENTGVTKDLYLAEVF